MPPINILQLPFIPFALVFRYGDSKLKTINNTLMKLQYTVFMLVFYSLFMLVSFALIPLAWVIGILDKIKAQTPQTAFKDKVMNLGLFIPFGIPILIFDTFQDLSYFWKNNYRTNLQKIII